jgi:serine/threonine protein phosphatase PrpC
MGNKSVRDVGDGSGVKGNDVVDIEQRCAMKILQHSVSAFLQEPLTTKETLRGEVEVTLAPPTPSNGHEGHAGHASNKLRYAVSEMQGWRSHMEDQHVLNPELALNRQQAMLLKDHHLFAVFDGHGGAFASKFCSAQLVPTLTAQKDWQSYLSLSNKGKESRDSVRGLALLKSVLISTFLDLDTKLMEAQRNIRVGQLSKLETLVSSLHLGSTFEKDIFQCGTQDHDKIMNFERRLPPTLPGCANLERSGSTGVVVLLTPSHIICANVGDSRAILSKKNAVLPLSFDHKPHNDVEWTRVEKCGGFVLAGRVDGDLAVSRSFGDFGYKNCSTKENEDTTNEPKDHRVTAHPDILVYAREPMNDEFLVLACDGIWDRFTNKDCSSLICSLVNREGETDVGLICEEVIDTALELDSRDNMTCCIVMFPRDTLLDTDHLIRSPPSSVGVTKRRLDREKIWGKCSTPAVRYHERCENRKMKHRHFLTLSESSSVAAAEVQESKKPELQTSKATGKKHKGSHLTFQRSYSSRSSKSPELNQDINGITA